LLGFNRNTLGEVASGIWFFGVLWACPRLGPLRARVLIDPGVNHQSDHQSGYHFLNLLQTKQFINPLKQRAYLTIFEMRRKLAVNLFLNFNNSN